MQYGPEKAHPSPCRDGWAGVTTASPCLHLQNAAAVPRNGPARAQKTVRRAAGAGRSQSGAVQQELSVALRRRAAVPWAPGRSAALPAALSAEAAVPLADPPCGLGPAVPSAEAVALWVESRCEALLAAPSGAKLGPWAAPPCGPEPVALSAVPPSRAFSADSP